MNFQLVNFFAKIVPTSLIAAMLFLSCNKQPVGPTGPDPLPPINPEDYTTITAFRALYTIGDPDMTIPDGTKKVRGVVISNSANEAGGNYRLQDESGSGLYLYTVAGSPVYAQGTVLEIAAAGSGVFTTYRGDAELKNVPQSKVVAFSGAFDIIPRVATAAEITTNRLSWSSSLVKINTITSITAGATNSAGTTYTITDATGSVTMFVRTASDITVNTSATSVTGYVSLFNADTQIGIRTATDLQ